jgi:hypothetical protein
MALLHLATAVALLLGAQSAFAETTAAAQGAEIRFVPATGGGTVSLGIYDRDGKLVRVLCEEWPFNRFRVGLNGLSTTWDGKDDAGQPVPEGTYSARGFVAGHIGISGEAIHFNDWIEGTDSPRIISVASQQLLPGGDILLMARLAGNQGALVRYSPESEARWRTVAGEPRAEPARDAKLAVSDTLAFALLDGKLRAAALTDGAELDLPVPADGVLSVAARGDRLALLGADFVRFYVLPGFASQGEEKDLPVPLVSLALLDQGAVAAGADGSVWRWQAGWSRLEMPAEVKVRAVSSGRDSTFWVLEEHSDGSTGVAHYHPDEGRLADWKSDGGTIISLAGTTESDYFVATLTTPEGQRTVAIRRKSQGDGWEYVFDKKITRCAEFGWRDGALVAEGGDRPTDISLRLVENPLDPGASRELLLRATAQENGPALSTFDGLPLLRISTETGYQRVMVVPGPTENSARFFQGDGACVEEYSISNIGDITSFDAGTIKMTSGHEVAAPADAETVAP